MTPSEITRKEVLDSVKKALLLEHGRGITSLKKLQESVLENFTPIRQLCHIDQHLNRVPVKYIQHCIEHDDSQQFELSNNELQVRLAFLDQEQQGFETDPYGAIAVDSEEYSPELIKYENPTTLKPYTHFRPYQVSFLNITNALEDRTVSSNQSIDTDTEISTTKSKRIPVTPVYYEDGKFFCDDFAGDYARKDRPAMLIPKYDRLNIDPLCSESFKYTRFSTKPFSNGKTCWNCDSEDHELSKCPEQRNAEKIRKNKTLYNDSHETSGRLHIELTEYNKLSSLKPGKLSDSLQEALGIKGTNYEPQFYDRMRIYGYPPGYKGLASKKGVSQLSISKESVLFENTPLLNIYDDEFNGEDKETQSKKDVLSTSQDDVDTSKEKDTSEELVELVVYPGLNIKEKKHTVQQIPQWEQPGMPDFYRMEPNTHQYYQQFHNEAMQDTYSMYDQRLWPHDQYNLGGQAPYPYSYPPYNEQYAHPEMYYGYNQPLDQYNDYQPGNYFPGPPTNHYQADQPFPEVQQPPYAPQALAYPTNVQQPVPPVLPKAPMSNKEDSVKSEDEDMEISDDED
ncbi:hypothetical protein F4703DRAFT_1932156 [Phycomyces blakesleeanus]